MPFGQYGACERDPSRYQLKQIEGDFGEGTYRFSLSTAPTNGNVAGQTAMAWLTKYIPDQFEYSDSLDWYHDTYVDIHGAEAATLFKMFCL